MMRREWGRLLDQFGLWPFGVLIIAGLFLAIGIDYLLSEVDTLTQQIEQKESDIASARGKKERLPALEKTRAAAGTAFSALSSRLVLADDDSGSAGDRFAQTLKTWYSSHGVREAVVLSVGTRESNGITFLRGEIQAHMLIENLSTLLQSKVTAPLALRLAQATVEVDDQAVPTGLTTRMSWETMRAPPKPSVADKAKSATKSAKPKSRVVERGSTDTSITPISSEIKRK
ncbi:MAG: hypothetical protein Q8O25_05580 [Sulfurisoma sp.]|nr:hypothetical protein [Sulfurisoma sp.]